MNIDWFSHENLEILKKIKNVIIGISKNFQYNKSIAIFNLNNNLIKNNNYKDKYGFKLFHNKFVNDRLEEINERKGSIIIIENYFKSDIDEFKEKIEIIEKMLNVPIIIIIAQENNYYSKPFTGSFKLLEQIYKKQKQKINKKTSICVGSRAGRTKSFYYNKNDYSDIDRGYAKNNGIKFCVPENFYYNNKYEYLYEWTAMNSEIREKVKKYIDIMDKYSETAIKKIIKKKFKSDKKFFIMITGNICSGKTTLCNRIMENWESEMRSKIIYIALSSYEKKKECMKRITDILDTDKSLILDGRFASRDLRNYFYKKIIKREIPIIIIELYTPEIICKYLNHVRVETSKSSNVKVLPEIIFTQYKSTYNNISEDINRCNIKKKLYIKFPLKLRNIKELYMRY